MVKPSTYKIKVKIKGYDVKVVDETLRIIMSTVAKSGAQLVGPIALPTKKKRWAVNRSPHIYKKSVEHFELRTHKRLLEIVQPNPDTIDALQNLQLPAGVFIELKQS